MTNPPLYHKNCSAEALQSSMAAPTERRVSTAVPLGDRQRRSDDADGSGYVSSVGPPPLVAVARRMRSLEQCALERASAASLSAVSMQVSERARCAPATGTARCGRVSDALLACFWYRTCRRAVATAPGGATAAIFHALRTYQ